jgi:hypothetical protein
MHVSTGRIGYNNNGKRYFLRGPFRDVTSWTILETVNQSRVAVAEPGVSSETQRKGTSAVGSRYQKLVKTQQAEKT